jgi:cytochrome c-type biogenesis protein
VSLTQTLAEYLGGGDLGALKPAIAFGGGLLAGFGPCILPMMPAVFGYVTGSVAGSDGEKQQTGYRQGLSLSGAFVLGMSALFSVIGAAAGLLGHALLIAGWASYVLAFACLLLGLHLLGLIRLPVDRFSIQTVRPRRRGIPGAFALGALFALVASPCSTPVLAVIATMAASERDAAGGAALLFLYGLGKGVPLLLIGLAAGSLRTMRSFSRLTPAFTKLGGAALVGVAAYLTWTA